MPPFRVEFTDEFKRQLTSWSELPTDIVRTLCESLLDVLSYQSAWKRLRTVPGGLTLKLEVRSHTFLLFVQHRDETFYVLSGSYAQD